MFNMFGTNINPTQNKPADSKPPQPQNPVMPKQQQAGIGVVSSPQTDEKKKDNFADFWGKPKV